LYSVDLNTAGTLRYTENQERGNPGHGAQQRNGQWRGSRRPEGGRCRRAGALAHGSSQTDPGEGRTDQRCAKTASEGETSEIQQRQSGRASEGVLSGEESRVASGVVMPGRVLDTMRAKHVLNHGRDANEEPVPQRGEPHIPH
jgi:hypothetical protein